MSTLAHVSILASGSPAPLQAEWQPWPVIAFQIGAILLFVFLNGFFVAAEFALVKVRSSQLEDKIQSGSATAVYAKHLTAHLNAYLSACQVGITIASLALGAMGEPFVATLIQPLFVKLGIALPVEWIRGISFAIALSIVTFLHITLGEQVPKTLAIRRPVGSAITTARPLGLFHWLLKPAILLLNSTSNWMLKKIFKIDPVGAHEFAHSAEELRMIVEQTEGGEEVSETEREILVNTLELGELDVRDIMTPRNETVCLDLKNPFEDNLELAIRSQHTRFPLVEGHLDDAVGVIHIKDMLRLMHSGGQDLKSIMRELHPVPEMVSLDNLLKFFLQTHSHLALVVDEFGGGLGIVTLDNVIEELVGDIQDEFDQEEREFQKVSDDEFVMEGTLTLNDLEGHMGVEFESAEVSTIGGHVTDLMGHLPKAGEQVRVGDFDATILKTDGKRIEQLKLVRSSETKAVD